MHSASDPDRASDRTSSPDRDARPADDATGAAHPAGGARPTEAVGAPPREPRSRRWFLAGGAAIVLGGGAGVAAGVARHVDRSAPKRPPAALSDALAAEHHLLALASAAATAHPSLRDTAAQLRRDHLAHARALQSELDQYHRLGARAAGSTSTSPAVAPDKTALRVAEKHAAAAAAWRAATLSGATATLLASVSACEATHVELLS